MDGWVMCILSTLREPANLRENGLHRSRHGRWRKEGIHSCSGFEKERLGLVAYIQRIILRLLSATKPNSSISKPNYAQAMIPLVFKIMRHLTADIIIIIMRVHFTPKIYDSEIPNRIDISLLKLHMQGSSQLESRHNQYGALQGIQCGAKEMAHI